MLPLEITCGVTQPTLGLLKKNLFLLTSAGLISQHTARTSVKKRNLKRKSLGTSKLTEVHWVVILFTQLPQEFQKYTTTQMEGEQLRTGLFSDDLMRAGPGRHSFSHLSSFLVICFSAFCVSSSFPSRVFLSSTLLCLHRIHPGFQGLTELHRRLFLFLLVYLTAGYHCSEKVTKAAFRKMIFFFLPPLSSPLFCYAEAAVLVKICLPATGSVTLQLLGVSGNLPCPMLCKDSCISLASVLREAPLSPRSSVTCTVAVSHPHQRTSQFGEESPPNPQQHPAVPPRRRGGT